MWTIIGTKRDFLMNHIDMCVCLLCFLMKHCTFSKSYCTVVLRKLNMFFGFVLRFWKYRKFSSDFEIELHFNLITFTIRSQCLTTGCYSFNIIFLIYLMTAVQQVNSYHILTSFFKISKSYYSIQVIIHSDITKICH